MSSKYYKDVAWNALRCNWNAAALITLIFTFVSVVFIGIGTIIVGGLVAICSSMMALNILRGRGVYLEELIRNGTRRFTDPIVLYIVNTVIIILWSLLLIIPGIIKRLSYSMSYYIMADEPYASPTEARRRSEIMMRGRKWKLFCLELSFIGWILLCVLSLGILTFWVTPYMNAAKGAFYLSIRGDFYTTA